MLLRDRRGALRRPASSARSTTASSPASRSTAAATPTSTRCTCATSTATRRVRQPWFACACCPPNVMRTLASLHHYLATGDDGGVQIHQYASGDGSGRAARSRPTTRGTAGSRSRSPRPARSRGRWACACRRGRPARGWPSTATSSSRPRPATRASSAPGAPATASRSSSPLAPRLTAPHPRVDAVRGCVAIERGPLVYCVEEADAPAGAHRRRPADRPGGRAARRAAAGPARRDRRGRGGRRPRRRPRTMRAGREGAGRPARDPLLALGQPRRRRDARLDPSAHAVVAQARARAGRRRGRAWIAQVGGERRAGPRPRSGGRTRRGRRAGASTRASARRRPATRSSGALARLLGDHRREHRGLALPAEEQPLAQRGAAGHQPRDVATILGSSPSSTRVEERVRLPAERLERARRRAGAVRIASMSARGGARPSVEDEVLLGREVVEHRLLGDVGGARDSATVTASKPRSANRAIAWSRDRLAGRSLLALAQALASVATRTSYSRL